MKAKVDIPDWLRCLVEEQALAIAVARGIPVEDLRSTSHKKTLFAEARGELVAWVREEVACLCGPRGATIDFRLRVNVPKGCETKWREPSYPVIGKILAMDHVTAAHLYRQWVARRKRIAAARANDMAVPAA